MCTQMRRERYIVIIAYFISDENSKGGWSSEMEKSNNI